MEIWSPLVGSRGDVRDKAVTQRRDTAVVEPMIRKQISGLGVAGAVLDCLRILALTWQHKGGGRKFGTGAKPQGVWGTGVPSGVQGRSPDRRSGGRSPPEAEEF